MANRIQIKRSLTSGNVPSASDLLVGEFAVNIPDKKIYTKDGADQVVKLNVTDYSELTNTPTLGTAAAKDVPTTGDAATNEVVLGSDTRLSDARAPTAHNQAWSTITDTPTTAAGYGITDVAPSSHVGSTGGAHGDATTTVSGFMSATDKTKLDGVATNANNYSLPVATDVVSGGVKLASATAQTVAANTVTSTASRTYGIQSNASGQLVVNVPWVDNDTVYTHPTSDGNLHVPATGTTNNGKVLTAGAEAGSLSWQTPSATDSTKLPLSGGTMTGSITFAAGQTWPTFNQDTTGNANTATTLATARTINGVLFNGSSDITINAVDSTSRVAASNGTASGLTLDGGYTEEVVAFAGSAPTLSPANGSIQTWTLTGNATPTLGTWGSGQSMTLLIDDGASYAVNWASSGIVWKTGGGTAPVLLTTGYTTLALVKVGTTVYGWLAGDA